MKDKKILFGTIIAFVFLLSMGLTYAFFTVTTNIEGEPNDILTSTGTLSILFTDGPAISLLKQIQVTHKQKHLQLKILDH